MSLRNFAIKFKETSFKLANEQNSLEVLLDQALNKGDKSAFIVFLDLLEEQNMKLREELKHGKYET